MSIENSISLKGLTGLTPRALNLNRLGGGGGGGGQNPPTAGSSLCCAEMVSSRKLKLSDFYYILIGLNSEYIPRDSKMRVLAQTTTFQPTFVARQRSR